MVLLSALSGSDSWLLLAGGSLLQLEEVEIMPCTVISSSRSRSTRSRSQYHLKNENELTWMCGGEWAHLHLFVQPLHLMERRWLACSSRAESAGPALWPCACWYHTTLVVLNCQSRVWHSEWCCPLSTTETAEWGALASWEVHAAGTPLKAIKLFLFFFHFPLISFLSWRCFTILSVLNPF